MQLPQGGWATLRRQLDPRPSARPDHPPGARVGAALILRRPIAERADDPQSRDLELVYTRRPSHLTHHPGQISFPGGRVEAGETIEQAALREATEEVALRVSSARVLGHLPAFYIPPSGFWLHGVVARWEAPHPLSPDPGEVSEILLVRLSTLLARETWRGVSLPVGRTFAWQLDDRHLLWGATAIVTAALLDRLAPEWDAGASPELLPDPAQPPAIVFSTSAVGESGPLR
ncbi:MAG TPA: CoA pyrophosphatase [Egibacteraceae bacterium]|nr:CoA pyrophosphatase [Egibacteraceae bacterium]